MFKKLVQRIIEDIEIFRAINRFCKSANKPELQIPPEEFLNIINTENGRLYKSNVKQFDGYMHKGVGIGLKFYTITKTKIYQSDNCFYDKDILKNGIKKD